MPFRPATSIHILGGGAGTGRWLVDRVLAPLARDGKNKLFCYDTHAKALETLDPAIGRCPIEGNDGYANYAANFGPDDWILIATPPPVFEAAATAVARLAKPGSLLVTMASVQSPPMDVLRRLTLQTLPSGGLTFCGCHLLCGTDVASPVGQFAAITGFDESETNAHQTAQRAALGDLLTGVGLIVSTLTPAEHDRQMAYVQALTHFSLLGFAATLDGDGARPADLFKVQTPNFQFLYAFASRVLKIVPTTTGSIQAAPDAAAVRAKLINTLTRLHAELSQAEGVPAAADVITRFREPLTAHEVDEGATVAASAVHQRQLFHDQLYAHRSTGELLVFRHRASGKVRAVRVLEIRYDEITAEETTVAVPRESGPTLAIAINDTARLNYLTLGIRLPTGAQDVIKKRNIQMLTSTERDVFWRSQVIPMSLDVTAQNPNALSQQQFEAGLPHVIPGVWRCTLHDTYRPPTGAEKVTLRIDFDPGQRREELIDQIRAVVERGQILA
ncbi:MAG: tyrA [Phycisphaerales bacterium]|nr:tyrA [Phycisphaerales bacterium]